MNTVKIYKITATQAQAMYETGEGYSLEPWKGDNRIDSGWDDGGRDYVLPDGYSVGADAVGPIILNDRGDFVPMYTVRNAPHIVHEEQPYKLQLVSEVKADV